MATNTEEVACDVEGCDAKFKGPQALGLHRRREHGIAGTSRTARRVQTIAENGRKKQQRSRRAPRDTRPEFDPNMLLRSVFPNGVPPRSDIITRTQRLIHEAEELHQLAG